MGPVRLWRTESESAAISACKLAPLPSCPRHCSTTLQPTNSPPTPQHFTQHIVLLLVVPNFAALESGSSSIQLRIDPSIMAASTSACCVMSAVAVGAVAGAPRPAQADRVAPANNVLLSARRSSTIFSGVALPSLARSTFPTEGKRSLTIVAVNKTTNDSADSVVEDSSAAVKDLLQSLQAAWEKSDDKPAIAGLVGAGLIGIWAAFGLIGAIEKLPFIPDLFEIVGILFTGWFVYRYLLFKPDREELLKVIDEQKAKITGQ